MKRIFAALMLAVLMGCTPEPITLTPLDVYRDTDAQIASQTDVTAQRMAGRWFIRQDFTADARPLKELTFALNDEGGLVLLETAQRCDGDICGEATKYYDMIPVGPGRWKTDSPSGILPWEEIWVMWMDFDTRTAAIGTPSGEFGWIIDKNPTGGGDRIIAARDIMDWFGYDVSQLSEVVR